MPVTQVTTVPLNERVIETGILKSMPVRVVDISREEFVRLVEATIRDEANIYDPNNEEGLAEKLAEELLPVARTMPRFPMGTWLHHGRGCGCVVGEYLVATKEIAVFNHRAGTKARRKEFINLMADGSALQTIGDLLLDNPLGEVLISFGETIDRVMRDWLWSHDVNPRYVRSVEIVDPLAS